MLDGCDGQPRHTELERSLHNAFVMTRKHPDTRAAHVEPFGTAVDDNRAVVDVLKSHDTHCFSVVRELAIHFVGYNIEVMFPGEPNETLDFVPCVDRPGGI